ncbi:bifunctional 3,4-dihydroxy-2-butanone-4-phosphate synthase/GTP cyclohydrolase II [Kitasatospora purpeofusca]|uniref:bifunctional 3,4-dihydroxy-2-butanone-4-phosphate synthase/GTP cyclohydrolase II n=1 Tax=Kitasatospora purpeofusca TaxID=67352 RepID=UPI0022561B61|nr:bifunctional 3,4-dihydroxy-2-butanone-4-phosphate synthase/GTP cyclohydrolase II [Kitasatospora purpeofusca]MCX4758540.1 bifunctional 3,4-dihydroxy-2-butanone-4-phosphate synthase/GTP cyclohydrolase II [Kitasatospora purpeofusca]WSR31017.1 bifunctional 3,4-dihydroxy-2-butanone-4-phosphate synthase/GTP cyclohydrolase II [Kitasatospora purpeofusca]WSR39051.1 bifunctional 3,4-dihydroxy-2-butanone-4-phosphate synthase/GTP cyclohydrolase II [Kitasatospora purpeofusca]
MTENPTTRPAENPTATPAGDPVGEFVLDPVERAVADIALGRAVIVVDDEDRENEGDIVFAASAATPELMAFTVRYSSGVICAPMTGAELDRLKLPPMTQVNEDRKGTAYAVSVDARDGVDTGISAADRARTVRLLASPGTGPGDLARPGHVFPLRAVEGGVLVRPGHTEAAVDLARLAGLPPAGAIAEVVNDDGTMARLPELVAFAREHNLAIISIEDLIAYRRRTELHVDRAAVTSLPTAYGEFTAVGYRGTLDGVEHIALVAGGLAEDGRLPDGEDVLVRVHSECLTGDVLGSLRCDCGPQLQSSLRRVAETGRGVVLYLRGHEGRGIGLAHKLRAYELQERGRDTVDANLDLGLPADARDYSIGAQMLGDLGVRSLTLLTNNPDKLTALTEHGLKVKGREPVEIPAGEHNARYLRTKRDRMGHELPGLDG